MLMHMLADVELPETFHFLGLGWIILHVVAIPLVFYIGYVVAKGKGAKAAG